MSYQGMLRQRCTIQRGTNGTEDAWGQTAKTWANLATNVPCWLTVARGRLSSDQARQVAVEQLRVYLPPGQDVRELDRIVIGADTYEVQYAVRVIGSVEIVYAAVEVAR